MATYNRVNGEFCCQNKRLLTDILRNQFGFEGFVVSDWGAVDDRIESLSAGLNLEMPYSGGYRDQLVAEAVREGKISEKVLDDSIFEYLKAIFEIVENSKYQKADYEQHHAAARKIIVVKGE